jgi:deoxyribodipyrimidine photolyase-related protein
MIESTSLADSMPHHKQKLVLVFSAMRHFAEELRRDGFQVSYHRAGSLEAGQRRYLEAEGCAEMEMMKPADWGYEDRLRKASDEVGVRLRVLPNPLALTTAEDFDAWAEGRKQLRLEHFYRAERKRRGWLMDGDAPAGDRWNFDEDNRETPGPNHEFPEPVRFEPDEITREVMTEVEDSWPHHFGTTDDFAWPVTRADAERALDDFLRKRLATFGPYEDAIVEGEATLYHSLLSVPLNLGLLHPLEVCERALDYAAEAGNDVPLQSIEGFIRQILGWREFIRHMYRRGMPDLRSENGLEHRRPLPELYWGADTRLRCLGQAVAQLQRTGHTHHIQRLMVLGNFSLIAGIDPRELNDWFLATYVDALDWVVTPNVMGMSQYADLGSFTSKPYAASGKYIDRMSDHCGRCVFDPEQTTGPEACPLNSLYWDFMDRHLDRWGTHPRMALMASNWKRRDPEKRNEILAKAREVYSLLESGDL